MSAGAINPNQLAMLMTGTELKNSLNESIDRNTTMDEMWGAKLRGSRRTQGPLGPGRGTGVHKSLRTEGLHPDNPTLTMTHRFKPGAIPEWDEDTRQVDDQHHRIAAAADLESKGKGPFYFSVRHRDMFNG